MTAADDPKRIGRPDGAPTAVRCGRRDAAAGHRAPDRRAGARRRPRPSATAISTCASGPSSRTSRSACSASTARRCATPSTPLVRDLAAGDRQPRARRRARRGGRQRPAAGRGRAAGAAAARSTCSSGTASRASRPPARRFDPTRHEAIAQRARRPAASPTRSCSSSSPATACTTGVIRPAKVSVSAKPPVESPPDDD